MGCLVYDVGLHPEITPRDKCLYYPKMADLAPGLVLSSTTIATLYHGGTDLGLTFWVTYSPLLTAKEKSWVK